MKNIINSIIVAVLVLGTIQTMMPFWAPNVVGPAPPPNDLVDGVQYIDGDWIVTGTEEYTDETIILSGNLTVDSGGVLIFNNVTLAMNCSTENGTYEINVWGTWDVSDNDDDPSTTFDRSKITDSPFDTDDRSANDYKYAIKVWEFASLSIENTVISESRRFTCVNIAKISVAILNMMPNSFFEKIIMRLITIRKAIQAGITLLKIFFRLKTTLIFLEN